jgi:hypothetical protein
MSRAWGLCPQTPGNILGQKKQGRLTGGWRALSVAA